MQNCVFLNLLQNPLIDMKKYFVYIHVQRLVYFEHAADVLVALAREKQLKNWQRQWELPLIESQNFTWNALGRRYGLDVEMSSA